MSASWVGGDGPDGSREQEAWVLRDVRRFGYPEIAAGLAADRAIGHASSDPGEQLWRALVDVAAEQGMEVIVAPAEAGVGATVFYTGVPGVAPPGFHGAYLVSDAHPSLAAAAEALAAEVLEYANRGAEEVGVPAWEQPPPLEDAAVFDQRLRSLDAAVGQLEEQRASSRDLAHLDVDAGGFDVEQGYHRSTQDALAALRTRIEVERDQGGPRGAAGAEAVPYELVRDPAGRIWAAGLASGPAGYVMTLVPLLATTQVPADLAALLREGAEMMPTGRQPVEALVLQPTLGSHTLVQGEGRGLRRLGDGEVAQYTGRAVAAHQAAARAAVREVGQALHG